MHSRASPDDINVPTSLNLSPRPETAIKSRVPPGVIDACVLASLTIVVVICILLLRETRTWNQVTAQQAELNVVDSIASEIRRSLLSMERKVTRTSSNLQVPGIWELRPDLRQAMLFDSITQMKDPSATYLIDADGRLRGLAADQQPPAVSFSDQAFFEFHQTHSDVAVRVSGPTIEPVNGNSVIMLSKRINDGDGSFGGIVAGSVDISFFRALCAKFNLDSGKVISVINTNGHVVLRSPADAAMAAGDVDSAPIFEHVARADFGAFTSTSTADGRERLVAYRQIDGFPVVVTFSQPTADIFAQWTKAALEVSIALFVLSSFAVSMIAELRRERARRATAEHWARLSAWHLSMANDELEHRIAIEVQSRKETQEKLAKSQRLEALGQLAGGIAHDINNVLQTVAGACSLVQTHEADNNDVQRLTTIAISAADRGSAVTQRLLLFARRAVIKAESIDTTVMLDDLHELLSHTLGDGISLKLDLADNVPDLIADRMQLETVIINLATNARDAMPQGGIITITGQVQVVQESDAEAADLAPGKYVCLSVADTGIGMDENVLARATEPFFSTKSVGQGTGLGLAMAKGFAEQSGGKLAIESRVGEGTIVSLWFPAGEQSQVRASKPAQEPVRKRRAGSKIRVLVVDDNTEASALVGEWLAETAFEAHNASSGEEALSAVKAGLEVDLLLTDLSMPGMDGLQLIREVRATAPDLPAILLTGNTNALQGLTIEDAVGKRCLVLKKPVRLSVLVHHIELLVGGATAL